MRDFWLVFLLVVVPQVTFGISLVNTENVESSKAELQNTFLAVAEQKDSSSETNTFLAVAEHIPRRGQATIAESFLQTDSVDHTDPDHLEAFLQVIALYPRSDMISFARFENHTV